MRLPFTPPLVPDNLLGHLAATMVPGVEEWRDGWYRRTVRLPGGPAIVAVRWRDGGIDYRGPEEALSRVRFLLDLDADPAAIDAGLSADPVLAPLVAAAPGRRVPRTTDPTEMALRAVLGQQVSTKAAATHAGRLVREAGEPVDDPEGGLTHLFPASAAVAAVDPESLRLPRARRRTLLTLAAALDDGLDLADREALLALPGVGPWTAEVIGMRALGDPDAYLATDLGVLAALERLPAGTDPGRWRPYRAYAVQHLWATLDHAVNRLPA